MSTEKISEAKMSKNNISKNWRLAGMQPLLSALLVFLLSSAHTSEARSAAILKCPGECECQVKSELDCGNKHLDHVPNLNSARRNDITSLVLSNNIFTDISDNEFDQFPYLERLDMIHNQIREVDSLAFNELVHLIKIRFDNNKLRKVDSRTFHLNPSLKIVSLSGNPLKLPSRFLFSESITTLYLSRCSLKSLPLDVFSGLTQLNTLILTHNSLEYLPPDLFDSLPKLKRLYLHGNPWRCDGDMEQLLLSKQDVIADYKKIYCVTADGGRSLLTDRSKKLPDSTDRSSGVDVRGSLFLLISLLIILVLRSCK